MRSLLCFFLFTLNCTHFVLVLSTLLIQNVPLFLTSRVCKLHPELHKGGQNSKSNTVQSPCSPQTLNRQGLPFPLRYPSCQGHISWWAVGLIRNTSRPYRTTQRLNNRSTEDTLQWPPPVLWRVRIRRARRRPSPAIAWTTDSLWRGRARGLCPSPCPPFSTHTPTHSPSSTLRPNPWLPVIRWLKQSAASSPHTGRAQLWVIKSREIRGRTSARPGLVFQLPSCTA